MAIPEKPISRIEHYLARANGQNVQPPDPISRIEHYLAGIAGGVPQELLDDVDELKSQLETKAEIDGYYQDMTVGDAEQMISTQYVEDTEPYLYRTTGGTADVGNREYVRKIVGGTLAWNQLVDMSSMRTQSSSGVTFTKNTNGSYSVTGTATGRVMTSSNVLNRFNAIAGHKYLILMSKVITGAIRLRFSSGLSNLLMQNSAVVNCTANTLLYASFDSLSPDSNTYAINDLHINIFDLTQMFGTTIADYIYQLEQTTAGAGVAFFRKLFPLDYYPYDAGSLKSVEGLTAHEMVGFNQWDEEWELAGIGTSQRITSKNYIPVIPGATYYLYCKNGYAFSNGIWFYDSNKNLIETRWSGGLQTIPSNCHYLKFAMTSTYGTTYNHDICINLAWSGTRNGEYEPYVKHSYAIDSSLTLRGIPKLSDDGKLMYDGDRYLPDGTVERKYGVVDLGTQEWRGSFPESGDNYFTMTGNLSAKIPSSPNEKANAICSIYEVVAQSTWTAHIPCFFINDMGALIIADRSYSDVATFKTAMSGVMIVYELATPTTETAEPYSEAQLCDDWGTERFVTDSIVPVGTETDYPANLRDKLQHLPDLASGDGYYAIKQVGTQMTLEPFRIQKAPTTDGSYTLRATVSGGVPTYTWEQEVVVNASEEA